MQAIIQLQRKHDNPVRSNVMFVLNTWLDYHNVSGNEILDRIVSKKLRIQFENYA